MTAGNIFALVNEPRDMAPFLPVILPEVVKATEHSHPDVRARLALRARSLQARLRYLLCAHGVQVRKAAARAKEKLLVGGTADGDAAVAVDNAIAEHVRSQLASLPPTVSHYAAEVTAELLDDREVATANAQDLANALSRMLCSYMSAPALLDVASSTLALYEARLLASQAHDVHAGKDLIVNIANIILAFAGRVRANAHALNAASDSPRALLTPSTHATGAAQQDAILP